MLARGLERRGRRGGRGGHLEDEGAEDQIGERQQLFLLAQRSFVDGTIVLRGAQAAREAELLEAVEAGLEGTQKTLKWLRTRISTAAPQELAVP